MSLTNTEGYICVYCDAEDVLFHEKTYKWICQNCLNDIENKIKNRKRNLCKKHNVELYYCDNDTAYGICDTWACFICTYTYNWKSDYVTKNFMCNSCKNTERRNSQI